MYTRKTSKQQERVAIYARVSSEMQAEEGISIEAQLAEMREYAAGREWVVMGEFVDAGVTGRTFDRPGILAVLAAVQAGSVDILLVHELSRLSRTSVSETFAVFDILGDAGVGFASVKEPMFDLSTPTGRLMLSLISAMNQYYVDMLIMHTKKAKRHRARQGLYNHSILPYGYLPTPEADQPPVIAPQEAAAVRLIFECYATGNYSFQQLADLLNDKGYHTREGKRFSKDTVTDMVRNPFYAGYVVYREGKRGEVGEIFDGQHEPIIARDLWESCRKVRQSRHHVSKETAAHERPYLVARLVRCHVCGRTLRVQSTYAGPAYREMSYSRGHDDCPHSRRAAHAATIHEQMSAIVRLLALPSDWQEEIAAAVGDGEEVRSLHRRRSRLETERRRLKEAYIRGDFEEDVDIYRRELARIRRDMDQLPSDTDLAQIRQAATLINVVGDVWDDATEEEQRDLMRLMLKEVHLDVVNSRLFWLKPQAPFIPLFRAVPMLQERELGVFTPVWPPEQAGQLPYDLLPPLTYVPAEAPSLPFAGVWPWPAPLTARITEPLSSALKARRQQGYEGGRCVEVPHAGVPAQRLDLRKWPGVSLEALPLAEMEALPPGRLAFVTTPFLLQEHSLRTDLPARIFGLLGTQGRWHFVDLLPSAMPGHWLFTVFPEAWDQAVKRYWHASPLYGALRQAGFQVTQHETVFYQAVSLRAAHVIARRRPGFLADLADKAWQQGLARLEDRMATEGEETLIGSELALVNVQAVRTDGAKPA